MNSVVKCLTRNRSCWWTYVCNLSRSHKK